MARAGRVAVPSVVAAAIFIWPAGAIGLSAGSGEPERLLLRHFRTGAERAFAQDTASGFRLPADTALRAMPVAVNDPVTAVLSATDGGSGDQVPTGSRSRTREPGCPVRRSGGSGRSCRPRAGCRPPVGP
ncbi:DUF2254 family protein [Nonomuraea sp. SBT364]|uniref:DUF2254 family protein n=1 Tax=Nonomuraea sp. SBT364 TaxID=1580530 RepID=UPI0018CD4F48